MNSYDGFDPTGYLLSEKLDGVCGVWNGCELTSRNGHRFDAPEWFTAGLPSGPLVGELWIDRGRFEDVLSVVGSQAAGDRWADLHYMIFEDFGFRGRLGRFADRVPQTPCDSAAAVGSGCGDRRARTPSCRRPDRARGCSATRGGFSTSTTMRPRRSTRGPSVRRDWSPARGSSSGSRPGCDAGSRRRSGGSSRRPAPAMG